MIKVHKTKSGAFMVEGLKDHVEEIPRHLRMPGAEWNDEEAAQVTMKLPVLRYAKDVPTVLAIVRERIKAGDGKAQVVGPGVMVAHANSSIIPPCELGVQIAEIEGGFWVRVDRSEPTDTNDPAANFKPWEETDEKRMILKAMSLFAARAGHELAVADTYAWGTVDDVLDHLGGVLRAAG